jgi:hypothetical protein
MFTEPHGQRSARFANVASATFTGNAIDALCRLLRIEEFGSEKLLESCNLEDREDVRIFSYG